jgi:membrane protease YdiL (CAAX protease family)
MKKSISLLSANGLYLFTMLLVIMVGSFMQTLNLSGGLIATEALLILLPTVLLLRARKIPIREGLRLNPIPPAVAGLCVVLGIATFLFSVLIETIMAQVTGMASVPLAENSMPKGLVESALYFVALAVFAPICEEALFRGAIQGAYERNKSAGFAITITALMFAFYHFRLSGLPGLLPVAFILGYVAWRTQSIYATMLIHFGMNVASAANTLSVLNGVSLISFSLWTALAGLAVAAGSIKILNRLYPARASDPSIAEPTGLETIKPAMPRRTWLGTYWPLFGAGLLYLAVATLTLMATLTPEFNPLTDLKYYPPRITAPIDSQYQVTNRAGQVVGSLSCRITPQGSTFSLECNRTIQGYEIKIGSSDYSDMTHTATWKATWESSTFNLLDFSFERQSTDGYGYQTVLRDGQLITTSSEGMDQTQLAESVLLEYEWAWRVNDLNADVGSVFKTPFGYLVRWNEKLNKSVPALTTELLHVYPAETLDLPAGQYTAWKVTLAGQAAWFGKDDPSYPRPIQFDDGMVIYSLVK